MFIIVWQVWLGEIGKKDVKNEKKINKKNQIVNNEICEEFWISNVYFLEKCSMIFQKSLLKSLIHKIKNVKIAGIFLQIRIDEIEKKKTNIKPRNFEKKNYFTYLYFCNKTFRNFQNSLIKSLLLRIKQYKKCHNFLTNFDRWNRKKNAKNDKKIKKEIVNDGILLKFWISYISIFLKKKTIVL